MAERITTPDVQLLYTPGSTFPVSGSSLSVVNSLLPDANGQVVSSMVSPRLYGNQLVNTLSVESTVALLIDSMKEIQNTLL